LHLEIPRVAKKPKEQIKFHELHKQRQSLIHSPAKIQAQSMTQSSTLATAQLAIYAVLSIPVIYILYRHGKQGFLGWTYLLIFCVLRMTGTGMSLSNPASTGAIVISNIGISPLLLSILGIMHEGRVPEKKI
jgi:prolipoprotein diacylglyceryltransferase